MENASKALIIAGAILISILLITIGIILINSGKEITTTGTSEMSKQNIQTFNSKFTAYQGKVKGSQVIDLLSLVDTNNAVEETHKVVVSLPVTRDKIVRTKDYTVTVTASTGTAPTGMQNAVGVASASEKGYINLITVS